MLILATFSDVIISFGENIFAFSFDGTVFPVFLFLSFCVLFSFVFSLVCQDRVGRLAGNSQRSQRVLGFKECTTMQVQT